MTFRMCFAYTPVIAIVVLVYELTALAKPPYYRVIELSAPNGRDSYAVAISDAGHVVGDYRTDFVDEYHVPVYHAVLWHNKEAIDLGALGEPDEECHARSVNSAGQVVGWCGPQNGRRAFLWLPEPAFGLPAGMNDLGTPVERDSRAYDINERGEVVGTMGSSAFLWLPETVFGLPAGLNDLCLNSRSCSQYVAVPAINDLTQIVTSDRVWLPRPSYGRLSGWSSLHRPGAYDLEYTVDLNNSGLVAGTNRMEVNFLLPVLHYPMVYPLWTEQGRVFPILGWTNGLNEQGCMVADFWFNYGLYSPLFLEQGPDGNPEYWLLYDYLLFAPPFTYVGPDDINNLNEIAATISIPAGPTHAALLRPVNADVTGLAGTDGYEDLPRLVQCLSGPTSSVLPNSWCAPFDYDEDGNVDLADYFVLQLDFDGTSGGYWFP